MDFYYSELLMDSRSLLSSKYLSFSVNIIIILLWEALIVNCDAGLEVMGPAYRTGAGMMICMFFAVALMILGLCR